MDKETRIGAVADYLVGKPGKVIEHTWGTSMSCIARWAKQAEFKTRHRTRHNKQASYPRSAG